MMRSLLVALVCVSVSSVVGAAAPVPVNQALVPINELAFEVNSRVAELEKLMITEEAFEAKKGEEVRQAFGVLACMGQAIAEHEDAGTVKIQGAALRDAALLFNRKSNFAEAEAALTALKLAQTGASEAAAEKEHPWNKLINMHPMMEEMNGRNAKIIRSLRRLRGTDEEAGNASVLVVLALAMQADTHEVKDPADLPKWNEWSTAYRDQMHKAAEAIRAKDAKAAREWLDKAKLNCDACHEVFQ